MSDERADCERFEDLLLESSTELTNAFWSDHLAGCSTCREQWQAHSALTAAFVAQQVPELSLAFKAGLERKIAASVQVVPLRGWRLTALVAYTAAALAALRWALSGVPVPTIEFSSTWVRVVVFAAIPLSFLLAMAASRWIPARGTTRGTRSFAL